MEISRTNSYNFLGVYFEIKILFVSNIFIYISKIDTVAVCYKIGIVRYIIIVNKNKVPIITTPLLCYS